MEKNPLHQAVHDRALIRQAFATLARFGAEAMAKKASAALDRMITGYKPPENPCPTCLGHGGKISMASGQPQVGYCDTCKGTGSLDIPPLKK